MGLYANKHTFFWLPLITQFQFHLAPLASDLLKWPRCSYLHRQALAGQWEEALAFFSHDSLRCNVIVDGQSNGQFGFGGDDDGSGGAGGGGWSDHKSQILVAFAANVPPHLAYLLI